MYIGSATEPFHHLLCTGNYFGTKTRVKIKGKADSTKS